MKRAVAGVVVSLPEPAIAGGHPVLPDHWARFAGGATLTEGPLHIHAIPDPSPVWDPSTSGWTTPPTGAGPGGVGDYRWSVDSLPDPAAYPGSWYWFGDHQVAGESHAVAGNDWATAAGPAAGPQWRSFFPFRPSVRAYDAYVGARKIHHPKVVHFNSHYVEHMWLDLGGAQPQPFTWILVASVQSNPFPGYEHHLLDSGRNPDDVGFPRLSASQVSRERAIADNLDRRTMVSVSGDTTWMKTQTADNPLRTKGAAGIHPRMYAMIFDGSQSQLAVYDPFGKYISAGAVSNGSNRFVVMGREYGIISQRRASNMLMFELRYWKRALAVSDLDGQYAQLSSTYQFDAYKTL